MLLLSSCTNPVTLHYRSDETDTQALTPGCDSSSHSKFFRLTALSPKIIPFLIDIDTLTEIVLHKRSALDKQIEALKNILKVDRCK